MVGFTPIKQQSLQLPRSISLDSWQLPSPNHYCTLALLLHLCLPHLLWYCIILVKKIFIIHIKLFLSTICILSGPVQALDFNPFQFNLLATGASDSEIYIWDLNNPSAALTPGNKILPLDNISCLAWNRQVQHILASTSPCGRCVVWDLRKNEPIIKVSDNSAMVRW